MKKTIAMIATAAAVITLGAASAAPLPEANPDDVGFYWACCCFCPSARCCS